MPIDRACGWVEFSISRDRCESTILGSKAAVSFTAWTRFVTFHARRTSFKTGKPAFTEDLLNLSKFHSPLAGCHPRFKNGGFVSRFKIHRRFSPEERGQPSLQFGIKEKHLSHSSSAGNWVRLGKRTRQAFYIQATSTSRSSGGTIWQVRGLDRESGMPKRLKPVTPCVNQADDRRQTAHQLRSQLLPDPSRPRDRCLFSRFLYYEMRIRCSADSICSLFLAGDASDGRFTSIHGGL